MALDAIKLTRRPDPHRTDCWMIYFGDIHCVSVSRAVGIPGATQRWVWFCGFYPGSHPGEETHCMADSYKHARAAFTTAWAVFLSQRTEADFEEWRAQRDWTGRKYAARDRAKQVPLR